MKLKVKKREIKDSAGIRLSFSGEITVNIVKKMKSGIIPLLSKYSDIELDLSDVTRIDSAGFQSLIFFRREAESCGKKFSLMNPSVDVIEMFTLYGENI